MFALSGAYRVQRGLTEIGRGEELAQRLIDDKRGGTLATGTVTLSAAGITTS